MSMFSYDVYFLKFLLIGGRACQRRLLESSKKFRRHGIYFFTDYRIQNAQRDHGVNESKRPRERSAARRSAVWANPLKCFDRDKKSGGSGAIRLSFQGIGRSSCGELAATTTSMPRERVFFRIHSGLPPGIADIIPGFLESCPSISLYCGHLCTHNWTEGQIVPR
jgi:hypothetical protein